MFAKLSMTLLSAMLLSACTSAQVIRPEPGSIQTQIEKGDRVNIVTHGGEQITMWVIEVEEDAISGARGMNADGKQYRVPFADIRILELERTDTLKTGLVVAAGFLTFGLAATAGASALFLVP